MANFNTHVSVALASSTVVAALAVVFQWISFNQTLGLIALGTIGGMLPDIDASNSRPTRLLFHALAILSALVAVRVLNQHLVAYQVLAAAGAAYVITRYGIFRLFNRLTTHRGVFHSILAVVFFALLTTVISFYGAHSSVLQSWLNGIFIALGYLVHLLLDECYSVDLTNRRIKKSFGTALKLYHYKNITVSLLMLLCTLALCGIVPTPMPLVKLIQAQHGRIIKL
jgi:hypothetical protein